MELKEWRSLAIQSVSLFIVVFTCCICFAGHMEQKPGNTVMAEEKAQIQPLEDNAAWGQDEIVQVVKNATKSQVESRSDTYIRIAKTELAVGAEVSIHNQYMESKIQLTIYGAASGSVKKDSVLRVKGEQENKGKVTKKNDILLKKLVINDQKAEMAKQNVIEIEMETKQLYEPALFDTEDAYYISLANPRKVFDKIVVIDAGHGGMDGGTASMDGRHVEKDYDLLIVKRLKKLLDQEQIRVYYTRMEDKEVSKKDRIKLANALHADLFISIHCNASDVGDNTAYGIETLYSGRDNNGAVTNRILAEVLLKQTAEVTGRRSRGTIPRDGLYLLHHARVPATIIEIGYMSNKEDLKFIKKESGQKKIAQGIRNGIMMALEEE